MILIPETDEEINELGIKGMGELGTTAMNAAVANAVFHATGIRVRDLPIRIEKLLTAAAQLSKVSALNAVRPGCEQVWSPKRTQQLDMTQTAMSESDDFGSSCFAGCALQRKVKR